MCHIWHHFMHYCFLTIVRSSVMRGKIPIAAISARHLIKAEEFNLSRAVNSQLTVLQWDCGAGVSSDYQGRHQRQASQFSCHTKHRVSSFFPCFLDSHPSLDGFEPHIACVFFFFIYFFLRIFTDSSHKAPNCSRPRGKTRQVLSITSFCVGLRCCGSHPHYHKHSCFTELHKLPLKIVTKYWVNSQNATVGWRQLGTVSCLSFLLTNKEQFAVLFFLCKPHNTAFLATSREFVCIAALQSPIIHGLSSIPQSQGVTWSSPSALCSPAGRAPSPKLPCWRIRKSARRFSFTSAAVCVPSVALGKVSGKLGQSSNHLNRGGGARRQIGKNNGSGKRFFLFVCLFVAF